MSERDPTGRNCSTMPQTEPPAHSRPVMNRFCFQLGLTRQSTARPMPAPAHRPANRLPKLMAPWAYSWASSTLAAQLGTRPTRAAAMGWKMPMPVRKAVMVSSPMSSKAKPIRKLNSRMKRKISTVWRRAASKTPLCSSCSSWQSISSAWPA